MQLKQLRVREGSARAGTEPHDTLDARLRHDIRQSLAALRALAAVVEAEVAEDAGVAERLRLICHEVDWIAELVSSSGSTDGDQDFSVVDVGAVVASTCSSVSLSAGCDVRIVQEPAVMRQAALSPWTGVANIGGGARTTLNSVIDTIGELLRPIELVRLPVQRGDVRHTAADTSVAESGFGYHPQVSLRDGLALMVEAALKVLPTERSASASRP